MKPQFVWEKEDVQAGMIVCRAWRSKSRWKPNGSEAKWTHKIGFVAGDATHSPLKNSREDVAPIAATKSLTATSGIMSASADTRCAPKPQH